MQHTVIKYGKCNWIFLNVDMVGAWIPLVVAPERSLRLSARLVRDIVHGLSIAGTLTDTIATRADVQVGEARWESSQKGNQTGFFLFHASHTAVAWDELGRTWQISSPVDIIRETHVCRNLPNHPGVVRAMAGYDKFPRARASNR